MVQEQATVQPMSQAVRSPATAFTALQTHPHRPAPEAIVPVAQPCSEVPSWTHSMLQSALMHSAPFLSACGGLNLPVARNAMQPQPASSSSIPTDAAVVGWGPPAMSMQNLVHFMVGSQMAGHVRQGTADAITSGDLKAARMSIGAEAVKPPESS
jgi:hypothetical protein